MYNRRNWLVWLESHFLQSYIFLYNHLAMRNIGFHCEKNVQTVIKDGTLPNWLKVVLAQEWFWLIVSLRGLFEVSAKSTETEGTIFVLYLTNKEA